MYITFASAKVNKAEPTPLKAFLSKKKPSLEVTKEGIVARLWDGVTHPILRFLGTALGIPIPFTLRGTPLPLKSQLRDI